MAHLLPLRSRRVLVLLIPLVGMCTSSARAQAPRESVQTGDGREVRGKIDMSADGRFQFVPSEGGKPLPLERVGHVAFDAAENDLSEPPPPFHVLLGATGRLSGMLRSISPKAITLEAAKTRLTVGIDRGGVRAIVQRPGEVQMFREDFDAIDEKRWSLVGEPEIVDTPERPGTHSLKLLARGAAVTYRLPESLGSGRFEIVYYDNGKTVSGQRWFVDLTFRGPMGLEPIQTLLGWDDETLAVLSRGGPALAVQPLRRREGWHRLSVRFAPGRTDLSVDGDELAHGDGPGGPLVEIRLATETLPRAEAAPDLAVLLDDVRLVRFTEPSGRMEIDPTQDEARLITGDQLFGDLVSGDRERFLFEIDGSPVSLNWSEVAGVFLKRTIQPSALLSGLWVRLEWRIAGGDDPSERDQVEGVLKKASASTLSIDVPYVGVVEVPRDQVVRLDVLGRSRKLILDPSPHHLGNRVADDLSPPQPEGPVLNIPFKLASLPNAEAALCLDVVQVIGESGNLDFSDRVKKGELRTNVLLNGRRFDDLNRHINTRNDVPARIRLPIPAGLLKAGENVLRFEQTGAKDDPRMLDNLGVLGTALEFPESPGKDGGPRP